MAHALDIDHLDVKQGESTLVVVRCDNHIRRAVLIDGGKQNVGELVVSFVRNILGPKK